MERIRVSSLPYFIRPVANFEGFQAQVAGLIDTAAGYKCRLIVFPGYFTLQLLALGDRRQPIPEQVAELADDVDRCDKKIAPESS